MVSQREYGFVKSQSDEKKLLLCVCVIDFAVELQQQDIELKMRADSY